MTDLLVPASAPIPVDHPRPGLPERLGRCPESVALGTRVVVVEGEHGSSLTISWVRTAPYWERGLGLSLEVWGRLEPYPLCRCYLFPDEPAPSPPAAELTELRTKLDYEHQMVGEMAHTADLRTTERDQLRTALRELVDSYTEWRVVLEDHDELIPWMRRSEVNDQMLVALSRATDLLPQAKPGAE